MPPKRGGQVTQLPADYRQNYEKIIGILEIKEYFPDIDDDLLLFAVYGDGLYRGRLCSYDQNVFKRLKEKYCLSACDNRILESHGDICLSAIISDMIVNKFKLALNTGQYLDLYTKITRNFDLAAITNELNVCKYLGIEKTTDIVDKHNVCSNLLENILGVLFLTYGFKGLEKIQDWFFGFSIVATIFTANVNEVISRNNLQSKLTCTQKDIIDIANFHAYRLPHVEAYIYGEPEHQINFFIEKTGYELREEDNGIVTTLWLVDPQHRFEDFVLATRVKNYNDSEYLSEAVERLVKSGFWIVPISESSKKLREK